MRRRKRKTNYTQEQSIVKEKAVNVHEPRNSFERKQAITGPKASRLSENELCYFSRGNMEEGATVDQRSGSYFIPMLWL